MESPSSSEAPALSEDSGLLITSGSISSDSASGWHHVVSELQESDFDERSLSPCEADASERMCGDFFNTVKKGPAKIVLTAIEPPPQFQDIPSEQTLEKCSEPVAPLVVLTSESPAECAPSAPTGTGRASPLYPRSLKPDSLYERRPCLNHRFASGGLSARSPGRRSLASRLSSSHSSLQPAPHDDSTLVTQAISHDAIADLYTVPFDCDVYAVPVDTVRPRPRRRRRHRPRDRQKEPKVKRHSLPGSRDDSDAESPHLTLRDMRKYLHTLYSGSEESRSEAPEPARAPESNNNHRKSAKNTFASNAKNKKHKEVVKEDVDRNKKGQNPRPKMSAVRILSVNLKRSFCNLFRWRGRAGSEGGAGAAPAAPRRALPPLPPAPAPAPRRTEDDTVMDFATSIQKVKDYGWYWGPISVEAAEKVLSNEPDGSFIVRDSSDHHYIFTLTFKLNGLRHVRIEHDQGNFCFGGCTMFKAQTIVEFIENAVETSRSGRYLFFLNLRPVLGPVRVQLLYPVSRFKRVQSLQHMCRFVILKHVRRDLIGGLPLPRRLIDYLSATHYYSELLADI